MLKYTMKKKSSGLIIAAPASGNGKTIITLGLIGALKKNGYVVAPAKVGPDYIDPSYLAAAADMPCFNLDPWAMRLETIAGHCFSLSKAAPLIICEGVMGLFDGTFDGKNSTADLSATTGWPVILVVDVKGQAASAAAVVRGFASHRDDFDLCGVIFNRVGGKKHRQCISIAMKETIPNMPILGFVPKTVGMQLAERHLGLIHASEHSQILEFLSVASELIANNIDLRSLANLAQETSIEMHEQKPALAPLGQHIAVARDAAFSFLYDSLLHDWRDQNAELSFFSPLANESPSSHADAIYLPGGYPELYAEQLADNRDFHAGLLTAATKAFVYGECGGFMVLGKTIIDRFGKGHQMSGLLPLESSFADPKLNLGYREVKSCSDTPLGPMGKRFRGHEFHYSTAKTLVPASGKLFACTDAAQKTKESCGLISNNVAGSFIHLVDEA
tara:strand:- start:1474 stop:2808 length:1335 start_codon:yes stop_codon:yes gene_type:complete